MSRWTITSPRHAIDGEEMWTLGLPSEDDELLPERQVLGDEARSRPEGRGDRAEDGHEEGEHQGMVAEVLAIVASESALSVR